MEGSSLFDLQFPAGTANPVLTSADIRDRKASLVADPFVLEKDGIWHLFFEVFDLGLSRGVIAHAESRDRAQWQYTGVVLEEAFHLSYPFVFEHEGSVFMIPETHKAGAVRLYRAAEFPRKWHFVRDLVKGRYQDPSLVRENGRWWLFLGRRPYSMSIFHSRNIQGPWKRHLFPFFHFHRKDRSRPGGRPVHVNGRIIRFAQDSLSHYGHQLRAFSVEQLTPFSYSERQLDTRPFLSPRDCSWYSSGIHHIDAHQLPDGKWFAVVDGAGTSNDRNHSRPEGGRAQPFS